MWWPLCREKRNLGDFTIIYIDRKQQPIPIQQSFAKSDGGPSLAMSRSLARRKHNHVILEPHHTFLPSVALLREISFYFLFYTTGSGRKHSKSKDNMPFSLLPKQMSPLHIYSHFLIWCSAYLFSLPVLVEWTEKPLKWDFSCPPWDKDNWTLSYLCSCWMTVGNAELKFRPSIESFLSFLFTLKWRYADCQG